MANKTFRFPAQSVFGSLSDVIPRAPCTRMRKWSANEYHYHFSVNGLLAATKLTIIRLNILHNTTLACYNYLTWNFLDGFLA